MFSTITQIQELLKSYYIALRYDQTKAQEILSVINELRLTVALDAEVREVFWEQLDVAGNASGYQVTEWFSKNDINYVLKRAIAALGSTTTIAAVNQGNRQRVITREPIAWQQIFAGVQGVSTGQQTLFDFPQEIFFGENEALGLSFRNQTSAGYVFFHGCTLKDSLEEVRRDSIIQEVNNYLPQPQLIPLLFQFPNALLNTLAVAPSGADEIFSSKYDRSVIITHVSTTAPASRITLIDEGRNQLLCQRVEARGIAATFSNPYTSYYELPYPHLLRRGDRLRMEALNGSLIDSTLSSANTLYYLNFLGYSL